MITWLYPRRCMRCDGLLSAKEQYCCTDCEGKLSFVAQPFCYCCGKPLLSVEKELCSDCEQYPKSFIRNQSLFLYEGAEKDSLSRFKFQNRREYAAAYAAYLAEQKKVWITSLQVDALLPVPVHKNKRRQRGYNQAELLAVELGKRLCLPVLKEQLIRVHDTMAQKELSRMQRLKSLERAFKYQSNGVKCKRVLLVDDIYTTGTTLEACTRVLLRAGVEEVYGITVAVGQGF